MDEPCFCTLDSILSCLVDRTKISLPVLITACALGYIWLARKNMSDLKKQCDVLEDDMNHIKRENYQIIEEIRRLKCTASDSQLVSNNIDQCRLGRSRSRVNQQCKVGRICDKTDLSDRSVSRRKKERITRNRSSSRTKQVSCSNPNVYPNVCGATFIKKSSSECPEIHTSRFQPRAESTRIEANDYDSFECPCTSCPKPDSTFCEQSCFEPKTKTLNISNGNSRQRSSKNKKRVSHSPENLKEHFNCCRYVEKPKSTTNLDMCNPEIASQGIVKNKVKKQKKTIFKPSTSSYPYTSGNSTSKAKDSLLKKSSKKPCFNDEPPSSCPSRSCQLKQKIDNYKKELANEINSLKCNPCQKDTSSYKKSCNFTSNNERCQSRHL